MGALKPAFATVLDKESLMSTDFPQPVLWAIRASNLIAPGVGVIIEDVIRRYWGNPTLIRKVAIEWDKVGERHINGIVNGINTSANRLQIDNHWNGNAVIAYQKWLTQWKDESLYAVRDGIFQVRDCLYLAADKIRALQDWIIDLCLSFIEAIGGVIVAAQGLKLPFVGKVVAGGAGGAAVWDALQRFWGALSDTLAIGRSFDEVKAKMQQALNVVVGHKTPDGKVARTELFKMSRVGDWDNWENAKPLQ